MARLKKSPYEKLVDKIIKAKETKYGMKYEDVSSDDYKSYTLYRSSSIDTYGQYKHYASFYGYKVLSKASLFRWYKFFFEVRTDCMFAQDPTPPKAGFLKTVPSESSKWTKKELNELKKYVEEEVLDTSDAYYKLYKVKKAQQ